MGAADMTAAGALSLPVSEICLRLLCAMLIGTVIGIEREYTHRPAGMRTHMLVSLGACVVMVIGQQIFAQYSAYGAMPDPTRLSAQVITGVGFLGAGTILREGATVKGLTTAASLWAVACLGTAVGGGYYAVALIGMVCILLTLTIFERFQKRLLNSHTKTQEYCVECRNITNGLRIVNQEALKAHASIQNVQAKLLEDEEFYRVTFHTSFESSNTVKQKQQFAGGLLDHAEITAVLIDGICFAKEL